MTIIDTYNSLDKIITSIKLLTRCVVIAELPLSLPTVHQNEAASAPSFLGPLWSLNLESPLQPGRCLSSFMTDNTQRGGGGGIVGGMTG